MEHQETIKEIKAQFRLFMNGVASQSMREHGINYKLNFGIELPRLKEIAAAYTPNHSLAQALWKENIRECKILATILQPRESFLPEIADIWIESITQQEIAEYACMNLFQYLPYASEKAFQWIADERRYFRICGFLTLTRLFIRNNILNERSENEFLDQTIATLSNEPEHPGVSQAAFTALRTYIRTNSQQQKNIFTALEVLRKSNDSKQRAIYNELKSETME